MRPKLLERANGYVADASDTTLYLITDAEQWEIPLASVARVDRDRMRLGGEATVLVYENRVSFRLRRVRRWTPGEFHRIQKQARREARDLYNRLHKHPA